MKAYGVEISVIDERQKIYSATIDVTTKDFYFSTQEKQMECIGYFSKRKKLFDIIALGGFEIELDEEDYKNIKF